jgi:choline dehydrogenase-like flavoprotein
MIEDACEFDHEALIEADVCIVGGGAAGITLALELIGKPLRVVLLEAGGLKPDRWTQSLYEGEVADEKLHSPPHRYRARRFGGSTTIWGGRCMPFDAIDFETRDYVSASGWPFALDALQPFYPRANELCEAGAFAYTVEQAFRRPLRPMLAGFSSSHFTTNTLERFSCPTNFGVRYLRELRSAGNIRVVLHANVTQIKFQADRRVVRSVVARTPNGRRLEVQARQIVLAAGGLEVARLLLANRDAFPEGIGNQHGVVGRYYMCHVAGTVGTLRLADAARRVWHGYDVSEDGIYCRRRLALAPHVQRRLGIGNFIARLHHPRITDPAHRAPVLSALQLAKGMISYEYGKRLHGEERVSAVTWLRHIRNVLCGPHEVAAFGWHMLRDRALARRKFPSIIVRSAAGHFSVDFHAEQQPNPLSRVTLTDSCDALGMPRIRVDWRYTGADITCVREAVRLLARDIESSGVDRFDYDPDSIELEMARYGAYGGHHLGTARMGTDVRRSVVDANCRVYGLDNLFVAGGAVFPTSSQANPTLTIVALAVRLASHLGQCPVAGRVPDVRATELVAP